MYRERKGDRGCLYRERERERERLCVDIERVCVCRER